MGLPVRQGTASPQSVQRWEPFRELEELQEAMGQLFGSALTGDGGTGIWVPFVDVEETEDAWVVEAELPGVKAKDVNVEVREGELVISGEIKERERKGILRRRTRRVGQFEYRVRLPGLGDAEDVKADLDEGVLIVRVPKPEQARPRRIEVSSRGTDRS